MKRYVRTQIPPAHRYLITDGHVDLPFSIKGQPKPRIEREYMGIPLSLAEGDFDYVRARKGGLDAPFMSIYIPASYQLLPDMGRVLADSMINMVQGIATLTFQISLRPGEYHRRIATEFRPENPLCPWGWKMAPIGNDIANVKYFFDRGIRYITLYPQQGQPNL